MMKHFFCQWCVGGENEEHHVVIIPWKRYEYEAGEDLEGLVLTASSSINTTPDMYNYEPSISTQTGGLYDTNDSSLLSHLDHLSMASKVAPIWFLSNYFYAMSLEWTSIASSTVLASMGSIFAFGFATCSRFGDERVTKWKIVGVTLCFMGGVATAWGDLVGDSSNDVTTTDGNTNGGGPEDLRHLRYLRHLGSHLPHISNFIHDESSWSLLGDICGLLSAVGYGAYTVLLRYLCPKDEDRMSMQLLFGYIGILNMTLLLPVAIWVILEESSSGNESKDINSQSSEQESPTSDSNDYGQTTSTLTGSIFLFLLLKGLLDNVLSDYLWARAVILTSATVASVGVGLTIPMAFFADWVMGNSNGTQVGEVLGATSVLLGFVFVNINGDKGDGEEEIDFGEDDDCRSSMDIVSVAPRHDVDIIS